jgi:hypothetical protein
MIRLLLAALLVACAPGCSRLNNDCQWPAEDPAPLDLREPNDSRHLVRDVELAEELSIRYGDVRWSPGPERGRGRYERCLVPLFGQIATHHKVTVDDILRTRENLADRGANLVVNVPVGIFYALIALLSIRGIYRRFSSHDELLAIAAASILVSVLVGGITVGVGRLWEGAVEIARLGNDHLSYRGLRLQWTRFPVEFFVSGVVLFWVMAFVHYWWVVRARRSRVTTSGY